MGLPPLAFTGVSPFSESLTQILNRAGRIANLPLQALQNRKTDLVTQKSLTTSLQGLMQALTTSLENLGAVGDRRGISATSSQPAKVAIVSATATNPVTYTISEITSVATAASETSLNGYANSTSAPVSSTGTVRLTVGSNTYDITLSPSENNLNGLRNHINSLNAGVTATVFTTGTGPTPNYLSVTANTTGATTLTLRDDPSGANTDLLTATNQGANANFKLNGVSVSKPQNLINDVINGLTFTIAGTTSGSETVSLQLKVSRTELSTALQSLVSAYNAVVDFLDAQIGESAGLLSGSGIIVQTSSALRRLTAFSGTGAFTGLASLGVNFDRRGRASFDPSVLNAIPDANLPAAYDFVNNTSGLASTKSILTDLTDPVQGLIQREQESIDRVERNLNARIEALTERINNQQRELQLRLQAADTLIARLESQRTLIKSSLEGLRLTLYGRSSE